MKLPSGLMTADEARVALGISRATLYAYVSRGLIRVAPDAADGRRSRYDPRDVQALAERNRRGRSRAAIAASTTSWGEPILRSRITEVADGRLRYRGKDAVALSATATLEETATLLWECDGVAEGRRGWTSRGQRMQAGRSIPQRCVEQLAAVSALGPWAPDTKAAAPAAFRIMRAVALAAGGADAAEHFGPVHERLSLAWTGSLTAADAIRRCLVLCADHELNASTYAARVVASTRAPLGACALAGIAALTGPLHGGTSERIRSMLAGSAFRKDPAAAVASRLAAGGLVPGFGHPLYPDGDPRAAALLDAVGIPPSWRRLARVVEDLSGKRPHIDFALLAVERRYSLPRGAAFGLFATGRVIGWIAHSFEQWTDVKVIRPRAAYVGIGPAAE